MEHSIEVHNSRLTVTLTFDLILIGGRGIETDYPCAKFGNFSFSRFYFIVLTDRQTDRITEADDHYTHATTIGVSNYYNTKLRVMYTGKTDYSCLRLTSVITVANRLPSKTSFNAQPICINGSS